jgi:hypothetical protein
MLRPTAGRPACLGIKHPSGVYDQIFITVNQFQVCWCGALSVTRGRVCRSQLLLALSSAVIFGSESCGTRDQTLLSLIRDSANLEGQIPAFIYPRNRVAHFTFKHCGIRYCVSCLRCTGYHACFDSWVSSRETCFNNSLSSNGRLFSLTA